MKKQIYRIEFAENTQTYEIPEGWEVDKFLDVTDRHAVMVLYKPLTEEEQYRTTTRSTEVAYPHDYYTTPAGFGAIHPGAIVRTGR